MKDPFAIVVFGRFC